MSMYPQSGYRKPFELDYARDDKTLSKFFNVVYAWMAVGLAITAAVAWFASSTPAILRVIYGSPVTILAVSVGMFLIAMSVQASAMRISANVATGLFLLYSALMGVLCSWVFLAYKLETIGASFVVTGGVFAAMSIFGFVTKRDLSGIGSFLVMALIGLVLASIVNLWVASTPLSWLITYGVLAIFIGLTAYETQKLKVLALQFGSDPAIAPRIAIIGSLMLYIAFINMFLSILRIMGSRR